MEDVEGVRFIRADITRPGIEAKVAAFLNEIGRPRFGAIISDAMSRTTGHHELDHSSSYMIGESVMHLCQPFLATNGNVLVKQFQGDMTPGFKRKWEGDFAFSKIVKPRASRGTSSEVYILFKGYRRLVV